MKKSLFTYNNNSYSTLDAHSLDWAEKIVLRSLQVRQPSHTECAAVQVSSPYQILQLCFCFILASFHFRVRPDTAPRKEVPGT